MLETILGGVLIIIKVSSANYWSGQAFQYRWAAPEVRAFRVAEERNNYFPLCPWALGTKQINEINLWLVVKWKHC